jgi:hypothetical protein
MSQGYDKYPEGKFPGHFRKSDPLIQPYLKDLHGQEVSIYGVLMGRI